MADPPPSSSAEQSPAPRSHPVWVGGLSGGNTPYLERPRATFAPPALDRMLPVVLQYWKIILICTVLGFGAAVAALPLLETSYLITARVLVLVGREMTPPPTAMPKDGMAQIVTSKRPEDLGTEIEIMKNPQLLEELVNSFGVDFFMGEAPAVTLWQQTKRLVKRSIRWAREQVSEVLILLGVRQRVGMVERVVKGLATAISTEDIRKSDVILVQLRMPSPELGVMVLNRYLELFLESHIATFRSPQNREFFAAEVVRLRGELQAAEAKLAAFKDEKRVWVLAEQTGQMLRVRRELADLLANSLRETAEIQSRMVELNRQEASLPSDVRVSRVTAPDPVDDEVRKQRALVQAQIAQTAVLYGERSPQIMGLRRQLDALNARAGGRGPTRADQETTAVNQQLNDVRRDIATHQTQLAGLEARSAAVAQQLAEIETGLTQISAKEAMLNELQREVSRLEREYQVYTGRLEDSRISEAMDLAKISNVRVISPPRADPVPVFPPLVWVLVGGTAIGLLGALGVVFLRDTLYPVVRTRRDVEQILGVPVLGGLPQHRALGQARAS